MIPISKDDCTTIILWIDLVYQRGIPTYPWLRKLIYCYGIRSSRFDFFAQLICLSVAHCHGWILGWPGPLGVSVCRASVRAVGTITVFLEHVPQGVRNHVRCFSETDAQIRRSKPTFRSDVWIRWNQMWLFIAYINGRKGSGLLSWSGFPTDQFSPRGRWAS